MKQFVDKGTIAGLYDQDPVEVVAIGSQHPLEFEPGTKWQYSYIGIAALRRIIEVAADQRHEKSLEQRDDRRDLPGSLQAAGPTGDREHPSARRQCGTAGQRLFRITHVVIAR